MYEYMRRLLAIPETRSQFDVYPPGGTAVFYPGGRVPEVGELFVQPALGGTLRRLVEADARGARPSPGRHRRRATSASTAATSRPPSAPSPSGWAGSCGPAIWPGIARGSSRRCG